MAEQEKPQTPEQNTPVAEETVDTAQQAVAAEEAAPAVDVSSVQELRPGMTVRVHQKITEGDKQRVQVFQGIITAMRGKTPETKTITVQKSSFGINVEKIFPTGSPLIEKIQIVKVAKVRRSKLYFLKDYSKRLKETFIKE